MPGNKRGFTSYTNSSLRDSSLEDHVFRFKMVLESHLGASGRAKVKLSTIAKEMGKCDKSAQRAFKYLIENSNLKVKKVGYIYEFYTDPDTSVLYGETRVSHIKVHACPVIKRTKEKELFKNSEDDFVNNIEEQKFLIPKELTIEEQHLVDEIAEWISRSIFNPIFNRKKAGWVARGYLSKYGFSALQKVYKEVAVFGDNPHPSVFYRRLKELDSTPQKF